MNLWYEGALIRRSNESSDAEKMEEAPEGGSEDSKEKERKRKKKERKSRRDKGPGRIWECRNFWRVANARLSYYDQAELTSYLSRLHTAICNIII